jgi:hypothetical protein
MRNMSVHGERGELSLVGWGVVLVVVGVLVAIPYTLLGRHEADTAEQGIQAIGKANDVSAEASLTNAMQGAKVWLAEQGSLVGYGVTQATDFDPQTKYDASATAEAGVVSIRGASPSSVVLVTKGGTGALCAALTDGAVTYGRVDAGSAAQCTGTSW